jgi:hypothetical protein
MTPVLNDRTMFHSIARGLSQSRGSMRRIGERRAFYKVENFLGSSPLTPMTLYDVLNGRTPEFPDFRSLCPSILAFLGTFYRSDGFTHAKLVLCSMTRSASLADWLISTRVPPMAELAASGIQHPDGF